VTAFETAGVLGALRETARLALGALADVLSKAFVRRDGAPPWGLDASEPPHTTLVIRAGSVATAQRVVRQTLASYPTADISVLAPDTLIEETRHEIDVPTIAAAAGEGCGYSAGSSLINALRERRFDTVIVAGEGNRRAELLALLSGADRRVEVRDDGAAHVFRVAAYKPLFLVAGLAAGALEKIVLSALVAVVWGSIAAEGWLWRLRSGPTTTAADVRE
jgi:hypothetical protein